MDPTSLEARLRLDEDSRTEFKGVAANNFDVDVGDLAREIAAFANSGGGQIFLGVEDDSTVTGVGTVAQADALMRKVSQACRDRVRPPIACEVTKALVGGTPLLIVDVPGFAPDRPYLADGVLFIRDVNQKHRGTRADLIRITQSVDYHFDEQPVRGAVHDDLDLSAVREFLSAAYDRSPDVAEVASYLRTLGCLEAGDTPTVAGVLFFGHDPQRWLPDATVSAARLPGTEPTTQFLDREEIGGRLTDQFTGAVAFLSKHLSAPSRVEGWQRKDLGVPTEVLREAMLNALAHRDYRMASQTRLFVYDDRVEVANPGELLNRPTLETIRFGISQRRNPRVAALLARAHSARREHLGIGIPEMFRLMRDRGLPEPQFRIDGGHFRVVLRIR
jgi:ATP-dependent DNA helicase RecG